MAGGQLPPAVAPRLPMAAAILAAGAVACLAVVLAVGVAITRGQVQAEPMGETTAGVLGLGAVLVMVVSLVLAAAAGVVGVIALATQPRWRWVSGGAVLAAGLVVAAYGVSAVVGTLGAGEAVAEE